MNIFVLDLSPTEAARAQIDKHVVKMPLETAQMLSSVSWRYGVQAPYLPTHKNHPCTLWAGETLANWAWLMRHGEALCAEYTRRYGREHACAAVLDSLWLYGGRPPAGNLTPFAQAMPAELRGSDAVEAYRRYYLTSKASIATWRSPARPPAWWRPANTAIAE